MNIVPKVAQAKAALNKNLAVTQSKLAKCEAERDRALGQIQAAVDRAEVAERSARDVERELRKEIARLHAENQRLQRMLEGDAVAWFQSPVDSDEETAWRHAYFKQRTELLSMRSSLQRILALDGEFDLIDAQKIATAGLHSPADSEG